MSESPDAPLGKNVRAEHRGGVACALLAVATFGVYWATLSAGVLGGDAGELQFVPPILGLPHPTGYPLQVLLHKGWSVVPIGSVAYRLNLLDAAIAGAAVGLVAAGALAVTRRPWAAVLGAAMLAFGELWWSQAVRGDKYTLNGLFVALVLLLWLRWRAARDDPRFLRLLAVTFGLSLTHHRSMLLFAPALGLGLLLEGWRPAGRRELLLLLLLVSAPLLLYLYVPWAGSRGLPPGAWRVDSPAAVIEYLLDRGYTSQIRPDANLAGRLAEAAAVLLRSFGPLGVLLGLAGLGWTARRDPKLAAVLTTAFLTQAIISASYLLESNYALPRHWVFYLPGFLIWSVWASIGLSLALRAADRTVGRPRLVGRATFGGAGSVALAIAVLAVQGATVWARSAESMVRAQVGAETLDGYRQDLQRSPLAERFGRLAFEVAEPNALLICDWEQATVLWYLQRVEGQRPDVAIRYPVEPLDQAVVEAHAAGRPVYVARNVPGLAMHGLPSSSGPLLGVLPRLGGPTPEPQLHVWTPLEAGITLAGVTYHAASLRPGGVLSFTLFWRAERRPAEDYSVSVRLRADDGRVLAQHDERHPALGTSPTSAWPAGQMVGDYHELPIGNRLTPGTYGVTVVLYRPEPLRNVRRTDGGGGTDAELIHLPSVTVEPRDPSLWDLLPRTTGG